MNVVACAQLTFQMLTLLQKYLVPCHYLNQWWHSIRYCGKFVKILLCHSGKYLWSFPQYGSINSAVIFYILQQEHVDGLVQERHNSIANALELCLSCTNPSIWHRSCIPDCDSALGQVMAWWFFRVSWVNTLRLRQNGPNFAYDIFKCILLNEKIWISINISLNFANEP